MILTDCSNLFASINNLAAKCVDRCTKLHMAHSRDSLSIIALSLVCGILNIADVGAKRYSNVSTFKILVEKELPNWIRRIERRLKSY